MAVVAGLAISAIGAATGASSLAYNATQGGGGGTQATQANPAQLAQQVAQQKAQLTSTVNQNAPNIQQAGGGGLSPDYIAQAVAGQTGTGTNINALQDIVSGGGGGSVGGGTAIASPNPPGLGNLSGSDIYGSS